MEKENVIKCPNCATEIDVSDALFHQLNEKIRKEYDQKIRQKEDQVRKQELALAELSEKLKSDKEGFEELVKSEVREKMRAEKIGWEKEFKKQVEKESEATIKSLQEELEEKTRKVGELNKAHVEIEQMKRKMVEMRDAISLEKEKEMSEILQKEKEKIKLLANQDAALKIGELEKQLADQKKLAEEMKRKAEQGSMQLQGEVQELFLESMLRELYPLDDITEVKKGQRGADIIHTVRSNAMMDCGKIYYESKRTKHFESGWLQKLRDDNLNVKADLLVLVTEAMPEGIDKFTFRDGVWICSFWEVKGLSLVLRQGLQQVHSVQVTNQGRDGKMEMLYTYLTGPEFKGQFEAIIEGFRTLQEGYSDEKLKMQKIWKEREKQLEKILTNAVGFYGSLKGIAGSSIPDIKMLE